MVTIRLKTFEERHRLLFQKIEEDYLGVEGYWEKDWRNIPDCLLHDTRGSGEEMALIQGRGHTMGIIELSICWNVT